MSIEEINEERQKLSNERIKAVKRILDSGITNASHIQDLLARQYSIITSIRTVKRDLKLIKNNQKQRGVRAPENHARSSGSSTIPSSSSDSRWTHCPECGTGLLKDKSGGCYRCGWEWNAEKQQWIKPKKPRLTDEERYFLGID